MFCSSRGASRLGIIMKDLYEPFLYVWFAIYKLTIIEITYTSNTCNTLPFMNGNYVRKYYKHKLSQCFCHFINLLTINLNF